MSRAEAYAILLIVGALASLLIIPLAFVVLWRLHVRQSRRHPERVGAYGWVLMLAPPVLIRGLIQGYGAYENHRVNAPGYQPQQWDGLGWAIVSTLWGFQLFVGWVVSLLAEFPAREMRARLVAERSGAHQPAAAVAGGGTSSGGAHGAAIEVPRSRETLTASTTEPEGTSKSYSPGPMELFLIGAVSAAIGLVPYISRATQSETQAEESAKGPLLLWPLDHDLGLALQLTYGAALTGAGLAAIVLRFMRTRYPDTDPFIALWGVITVQSFALLQAGFTVPGDLTAAKTDGSIVCMALGAWACNRVAFGSRANALVGLAFVAVAVSWSLPAWPTSWVAAFGLLAAAPVQLLVSGPLLGVAIAWAGFDTVRTVRASAAAIGITWVLYTALRALWVLNPQTESGAALDGVRRWVGEFVANLLTPSTLFFTIAVPMAVAALGIALRQSSDVAAPAPPEPAAPPKIRIPR